MWQLSLEYLPSRFLATYVVLVVAGRTIFFSTFNVLFVRHHISN